MKIRKYMALISILLWSVLPVQNVSAESGAEPNSAPVMKRDQGAKGVDFVTRRLESINRRLDLSTEQQAKIRSILLDEVVILMDLRTNSTLTINEKKAKIQELREATDIKIRPILTAEQLGKHDTLLKNLSERRKNRENKE